ncbi:39S ribosomal protein L23, mitochondrial isoform X3 [Aquila chrysaetos chrysaetos]|uniref:39S ribosomal protein L23, mitochondrial isoform X3 n=1 Tax=Aquila chrysaetos chrysaetos TaxID=223781 RepID=UPI001B7D3A1F|nr:39S ribosomal protein L23, mitochondrial isoform X3 [Aquila chrysaetos chrysaetos]
MATGAKKAVYPLFQLGGPQLRIFRPNFFMLAVRPGVPQPEDTVQFRVSMEMTKVDIKNYLEKIYNVPVAAVRTRIQYGANNKRNHKNQRVKKPDYKVAYVQLEGLCFGGQILPPGLSVLGFCLQEIRIRGPPFGVVFHLRGRKGQRSISEFVPDNPSSNFLT